MLVLLILNGHLIENSAVEFEANSPNAGYYLVIFVVNVCNICDICRISSEFPAWQSGWSAGMQ